MNIAVLFGGISTERTVSISGGQSVVKALKSLGHNVFPIDPAFGAKGLISEEDLYSIEFQEFSEDLSQFNPKNIIECVNSPIFNDIDIAFLVLHGKYGEDGRIQALLEMRGIPYTGSGVKASAVAMDKVASKLMFLASGIPTPPWVTIRRSDAENHEYLQEIRSELGDDLVVKPINQGSAIGVTIVEGGNLDDIQAAVLSATKFSKSAIIERFIPGRELTVGIIGNEAMPVIEIIPEGGFYDFKHKYFKGHTQYVCPAEIYEETAEFAQTISLAAYNAIGCLGFGRVDLRMSEEGELFMLEVNTIPGFTSTSLVPKAAAVAGVEFPELCQHIIDLALEK
jgi:D-alanine-D-alanine ligase